MERESRAEDGEKQPVGRGDALVAHLKGRATTGLTTDQIMELTRAL
jgi:hypothetical protein